MKNPLLLLGAGGFAREAYSWIHQSNDMYQVIAFVDEDPEKHGKTLLGVPVFSDFRKYPFCDFLVAVGNPKLRESLFDRAVQAGLSPCHPIIHPSAIIGYEAFIARGSIICPGVVMTVNARIEMNTIVNINATVGHDSVIGNHSNINPNASISGNVTAGDRVVLGTNCSIREKISIGSDSVIGAGTTIVKDVPPGTTMIGYKSMPLRSWI